MNWILLALLAPLIYAVNVFVDKYLISSKIKNYRSLPVFGIFLAVPAAVIFWVLSGFALLNFKDSLLIILTGMLTIWAFSFYLEALIKEETSLLIILIQLIPVIVLTLAYFILGETISLKQLFGFGLLLASSILISIKKDKSKFRFTRALVFILIADFLWASAYILVKFASSSLSFSSLIMYESLGVLIGGLGSVFFVSSIREAFLNTIRKIEKPVLGAVLFNESLYLGAKIITYLAVSMGPPALISVLGSTQIFYGIFLGIILTMLLPKVFKENLSKQELYKKMFLGAVTFVGVVLLT